MLTENKIGFPEDLFEIGLREILFAIRESVFEEDFFLYTCLLQTCTCEGGYCNDANEGKKMASLVLTLCSLSFIMR